MKFHPFLYSTLCLGVLSVSAAAASAALPRTWSVAAGVGAAAAAGAGREAGAVDRKSVMGVTMVVRREKVRVEPGWWRQLWAVELAVGTH